MTVRASLMILALFAVGGCYESADNPPRPVSEEVIYLLQVRTPGEGSVLRGSAAVDLTVTVDSPGPEGPEVAAADRPAAKTYSIHEEIRYRETIEAFPEGAKRPTRARVIFTKWHRAQPFAGLTTAEELPRVVGREIVVQKLHGWYDIFATDGHPIDPHLRLFIDQRYSDFHDAFTTQDLVPPQPVQIGESWPIPVMKWTRWLDHLAFLTLDEKQSHGFARLVRIFDRDGHRYARLAVTTQWVPQKDARAAPGISAPIDVHWDVTLCVDGTWHDVEVIARVQMAAETPPAEQTTGLHLSGTITWAETEERIGQAASRPGGALGAGPPTEPSILRAEDSGLPPPVAQPPPPFPKN